MSAGESVLVVIIIVLAVYLTYNVNCNGSILGIPIGKKPSNGAANGNNEAGAANGNGDAEEFRSRKNYEGRLLKEQLEYFSCKPSNDEIKNALDCLCEGNEMTFAVAPFGAPGLEYKDWAMSQAIDMQTVKNHSEFVNDRLNEGNWTGRTWMAEASSEFEGGAIVPWQGIRGRPQKVAVCDPTQIADYNENEYSTKPRLTWNSV